MNEQAGSAMKSAVCARRANAFRGRGMASWDYTGLFLKRPCVP